MADERKSTRTRKLVADDARDRKRRTSLPTDVPEYDIVRQEEGVAGRGEQWKSRIVGHGKLPPSQILANPFNARFHPKSQQDALEGVLLSVGVVQDVIINQRTGHLVDGHLRTSLALKRGQKSLDVKYVDLSEDEEKLILATLDPISALALTDEAKQLELIADVGNSDIELPRAADEWLASMADEMGDRLAQVGTQEGAAEDARDKESYKGIYQLREDVLFPSSNQWGIPDYLPEMLSDQVPRRIWNGVESVEKHRDEFVYIYGTSKPPELAGNLVEGGKVVQRGGILAFYTDDWRFEVVWNEAVRILEKFLNFGWGSIIAPDFSLWANMPKAVQMWNLYRSRWVARYWQEAGIPVIPTLMWTDDETFEVLCSGIPEGVPVLAMQVRTTAHVAQRAAMLQMLHRAVDRLKPGSVLLYGGEDNRDWLEGALPDGPEWIITPGWTNLRRKTNVIKQNRRGGKALIGDDK